MKTSLLKTAFVLAAGEAFYISLVATIMSGAEKFLGNKPDNFLAPMTFLLLFVISAAISGALVFGKPILLYLEGKKKEAIWLLTSVLGWMFLFFIIAVGVMVLI